ncbi:MAG: UvrD-helicase domain-containing protein [Bacteroidetes bacterium]|nr:UvrD-helicase domain-containing protein [Bacteroidota bacterium]
MKTELKLISGLSSQQKKGLITDRNLILSAGAGAGKTSVLTARYLHLILNENIPPSRILAVTFTRNGADEIRNRVLAEIRNLELSNESERFKLMLGVARADIVTFDSLFLSLYSEFAPKAGFSPRISIVEAVDKTSIMAEIHAEFMTLLNRSATDSSLAFGSVSWQDIKESVEALIVMDKFADSLKQAKAYSLRSSDLSDVYFMKAFSRLGKPFCEKFTFISGILCQPDLPVFQKVIFHFKNFENELPDWFDVTSTHENEPDFWLKKLKELISGWEMIRDLYPETESQKQIDFRLNQLLTVSDLDLQLDAVQDSTATQRLHFSRLTSAFLTEYEIRKRKRLLADYSDIQNIVYGLIRNGQSSGQNPVIEKLSGRYDQVLVDEFQDTNYQQWEILKPFVWDYQNQKLFPARLFIVGDPKQSIFRFRNAQVSVFRDLQTIIQDSNRSYNLQNHPDLTSEEQNGIIGLTENFRSCKSVLGFVNSLFQNEFTTDPDGKTLDLQVDYAPMSPAKLFGEGERQTDGSIRLIQAPKNEKILVLVNELVAWVDRIESGEDKDFIPGKDKIAVIASKNDNLDEISRFLRQRNLPHRRSRGLNLLQTREGADILNWVRFLADTENDLAFIGLTKSPFLLLADEDLMILKHNQKGSFWSLIKNGGENENLLLSNEQAKLSLFRAQVNKWQKQKLTEPVTAILWEALTETGAWLAYQQQVNREQVIANLTGLIDQLTRFESISGGTVFDLADFLENLRIEAEGISEVPLSTGSDSVSIDLLTVHKSKGLTYKYVLVLDDFKSQNRGTQDQYLSDFDWGMAIKGFSDNEWVKDSFYETVNSKIQNELKAEANRVVYVALTRATHQTWLIGDFQVDKNLIYSPQRNDKSWSARIMKRATEILALPDVEQSVGNLSWQPEEPKTWISPGQTSVSGDENVFTEWLVNHKSSLPLPDAWFTNFTATGLMAANQCGTANRLKKIQANRLKTGEKKGITSAEKGNLVHLLLSLPESDWLKQSAAFNQLSEKEVNEIFSTVKSVSGHPFFQKLQSGEKYQEMPFISLLDGRHLQGSIDSLVINGDEAWIVDYKTNKTSSGQLVGLYSQYELQLKLYAWAVSSIFSEVKTFHLYLFSTALNREIGKTWTRNEVELFKFEILPLIEQIENQEYDRDYQSVASYLCEECSFYQFCYRDELKQGQSIE